MEFTKIFGKVITIYYFVSCVVAESEEICIKGRYHKDKPSLETDEYKACSPWKNHTCCTVNLDRELAQNDSPSQYNQTWHHCGSLSQECLKFWKRQECFYQCSPYVYKWQSSNNPEAIEGVPICANDCNLWFDACRDDKICVENVLEDECPANKSCKKFAEMYKDGKELCEKLWGSSYKYTEENAKKDNCMVLWFPPGSENPNKKVKKAFNSGCFHNALIVLLLFPIYQAFNYFM